MRLFFFWNDGIVFNNFVRSCEGLIVHKKRQICKPTENQTLTKSEPNTDMMLEMAQVFKLAYLSSSVASLLYISFSVASLV